MGDRLQHPVTDLELLRLAPAPWGHDLVHRSAGELGPPVAGWLGDGEGHEAVGAPVVVPAHHLAGHDRAELGVIAQRSEEHTSELQSLMRISYAVFCLKKKK